MSDHESGFGSWDSDDGSLQSFVSRQPKGSSGGIVDRLLSDLGSDPNHWFAEHQRVTGGIREVREEIAGIRKRLATYAALYESHGQQPSMFDNLRKIKLAEQVEAIRAAVKPGDKAPAEAALDSMARKSRPYQDFVTHHHKQKERWLAEKEDEAKLWAELRALEGEQEATMERIRLLRSLIYYRGQEAPLERGLSG